MFAPARMRSTFVAIQKIAGILIFCRRVDMEKFATNFRARIPTMDKSAWKTTQRDHPTANYFQCMPSGPYRIGMAKSPK
jgi:hypothetical protein